jgi:hypothetical protein
LARTGDLTGTLRRVAASKTRGNRDAEVPAKKLFKPAVPGNRFPPMAI